MRPGFRFSISFSLQMIQRLVEALDHTLVLINPCQNPDGHERFATWYNAHGSGRPEHYAYEHQEPWSISGRLNHQFFDLNRDLVSLSQPESQAATKAFLQWHPQILADHHGQTKEYFFPPPALPINPNLPEKATIKWLDIFGKANAEAFDKYAWPYFVRERFDLFYPGYWDSWSSLHGATGMTYETDGGGALGLSMVPGRWDLLTLRSAIAKHFTADLATVQVAAANRESGSVITGISSKQLSTVCDENIFWFPAKILKRRPPSSRCC